MEAGAALLRGIAEGQLRQVRQALEAGASADAFVDQRLPLAEAAEEGDKDVVRALLAAGAHPDGRPLPGESGAYDTPLIVALMNRNVDAAMVLIQAGADVNRTCELQNSPLHYACQMDEESLTAELLAHGANVHAVNSFGSTPLHFACLSGSAPLCTLLLEAGAASDLEVSDDDGTPFEVAAQEGFCDVMQLLRTYGADVNKRNTQGMNAVFYAAKKGSLQALEQALEMGVDASTRDVFGQTPLHLLATAGMRMSASRLDDDDGDDDHGDDDDQSDDAENRGVNGNILANGEGLEFGEDDDEDDEVIAILKNLTGAGGNSVGGIDTTELTVRLVEAGVDINAQDRKDQTALHVAAELGNAAAVKALLASGANKSIQDQDDHTAKDLAEMGGFSDVVALLA